MRAVSSSVCLVRSRHVVAYWERGSVVLRNYALGTSATGDSLLCLVAGACTWPSTASEIYGRCSGETRARVDRALARLRRGKILYDAARPLPPAEAVMDELGEWNPEAGFFHTATQNVRYRDSVGGTLRLDTPRGLGAAESVKPYKGAVRHSLSVTPMTGEFPTTLLARRTFRRFSAESVSVGKLSTLLQLAGGIQGWLTPQGAPASPIRTSPSGGARMTIDLYVVAYRIDGLQRGIYYYQGDSHRLAQVRRGIPRARVERYLPQQYWYNDAAALILLSASFKRAISRYRYSRAYRSVLLEAGHVCQTLCLTATWLGLAPFSSAALDDRVADRDLGLNGITESVLYAAGIGHPKRAGEVSSTPDDVDPTPIVPNPVFKRTARRGRTLKS